MDGAIPPLQDRYEEEAEVRNIRLFVSMQHRDTSWSWVAATTSGRVFDQMINHFLEENGFRNLKWQLIDQIVEEA